MEIYDEKGCKCKDSDPIYSSKNYSVIHEESIKKIKDTYKDELLALTIYGKIILGHSVTNNTINNWAKAKHYYQNNMSELSIVKVTVAKANSILSSFDSSGKVDSDLRCGKELLTLSLSLFKEGAKTLLFDKGCKHSLRILITSDTVNKFSNNTKSTTQTNFIALLQKVFHELGEKYNPVYITSGYRTTSDQAGVMSDLLAKGVNIAKYYSGAKISLPYLSVLQNLYDGDYDNMLLYQLGENSTLKSSFIQLISNYIKGDEVILGALSINDPKIIKIGGKLYNISTVNSVFYKNRGVYQLILAEAMEKEIFTPSSHLLGRAFDLRRNTSGSEGKAYNLHKPDTSKRDTSNGTNPHYHLTVN